MTDTYHRPFIAGDHATTLHTKNRYRVEWCAAEDLEATLNAGRYTTDMQVVPFGTGFYIIWRT